jgi:2-methylcitrate dehydratase PrpD
VDETRQLARFVAEADYARLPPEVVEATRIFVLDDLAAGCAGAQTPWAEMVAGLAHETSSGPCTVFGRPWTTSPAYAALVNGVMIGGFEVDHPFTPGSCHPSGAVFPAVLAMAEREGRDGRALITAVAAGYELLCRVGLAATRAVEDERGFHGPGTNAAFGAAAGAAKAGGLTEDGILNALGIAGSHGGGLGEFFREGAMTKRLHLGRGAQMGVECALLAGRGFTGPSTVLEGSHGFLRAYSPSPKPELLVEGLGERYVMLGLTLKAYPCHISFHAVIDGIQRFRRAYAIQPEAITSIRVASGARMMEERFADRGPATLMGAQYSLPWSLAFALCQEVADPQAWLDADLDDPAIRRLAGLVELCPEPERVGSPGRPVANVTITIGSATHTFSVTDWKGAPSNPYTYTEMAEKFARYAGPLLPAPTIAEIVERVADLERQPDVGALARLLAAPNSAPRSSEINSSGR